MNTLDKYYLKSRYPHFTINKKYFPPNLKIKNNVMFASGRHGMVWNAIINDINVVIKIIPIDSYLESDNCRSSDKKTFIDCDIQTLIDIKREIDMYKYTSSIGISPKLYYSTICNDINIINDIKEEFIFKSCGIIISEKVDSTMSENTKIPEDVFTCFANKITKYNYYNIDLLQFSNIGLKFNDKKIPIRMYDIDVGASIIENVDNRNNIHKLLESLNKRLNIYYPLKDKDSSNTKDDKRKRLEEIRKKYIKNK